MANIKKVKIDNVKELIKQKNYDSSILNENIKKISQTNETNSYELMSFRDDIVSFLFENVPFLKNKKMIAKITNELELYGFSEEQIKEMKWQEKENGDLEITCQNGDKIFLVKEGNSYRYDAIAKASGEYIDIQSIQKGYDVTLGLNEEEQEIIKRTTLIKDSAEIKGYVNLNIKGQNLKVYWIGGISFEDYMKRVHLIEDTLKFYPQGLINKVLEDEEFKGFFIGEKDKVDFTDDGYDGLAFRNKFVFINADEATYDNTNWFRQLIIHEFAHVIDYEFGKESYGKDLYYSEFDKEMAQLYEKYKKIIQPLLTESAYGKEEYYPDGVPNNNEFFASAVETYYSNPDELKKTIPELYEHIDKIFQKYKR